MATPLENDFDGEIGNDKLMKQAGIKITGSLEMILYQTSKHLCINTGLSIGTVIDWLDGNGDTVYGEQVGNIRVYYLENNMPGRLEKPKKLYFGGKDGRTICLRLEVPRGNTGPHQAGQTIKLELPKPLFDEKPPPVSRQLIDTEQLQELAEINPDLDFIADQLEMSVRQLKIYVNNQPNIKRAYDQGRKIYMENNQKTDEKNEDVREDSDSEAKPSSTVAPQSNAEASASGSKLKDLLTPAIVEQAAFDGLNCERLATQLGLKSKYSFQTIAKMIRTSAILLKAQETGKVRRRSAEKSTTAVQVKKEAPATKKPIELPEKTPQVSEVEGKNLIREEPAQNSEVEPIEKPEPERPDDFHDDRENSGGGGDVPANWKIVPQTETESSGDEDVIETDPRFSHTLERIGNHGHSPEKLEAVKNKLMPPGKSFFGGEVEILGRIGSVQPKGLSVSFNGDFFALTRNQRNILSSIASLNEEFQKENQ